MLVVVVCCVCWLSLFLFAVNCHFSCLSIVVLVVDCCCWLLLLIGFVVVVCRSSLWLVDLDVHVD